MKSHTVYLTFRTERRCEFIRITEDVEAAVRAAGISEGMTLVSAMHITAGVWINDDEPGIQADALEWLDNWRRRAGASPTGKSLASYRPTRGTTATTGAARTMATPT